MNHYMGPGYVWSFLPRRLLSRRRETSFCMIEMFIQYPPVLHRLTLTLPSFIRRSRGRTQGAAETHVS